IGSSWAKPHMVIFQNDGKFYARNSNGKYTMDVDQLRIAFTVGSAIVENIEKFRSHRIDRIRSGDLPVDVGDPQHYVLHSFPYSAFSGGGFVDLSGINADPGVNSLIPGGERRI